MSHETGRVGKGQDFLEDAKDASREIPEVQADSIDCRWLEKPGQMINAKPRRCKSLSKLDAAPASKFHGDYTGRDESGDDMEFRS